MVDLVAIQREIAQIADDIYVVQLRLAEASTRDWYSSIGLLMACRRRIHALFRELREQTGV
jgi:hypothetical protein